MNATKTSAKKWTLMSVPGRKADGSDAVWFAHNRVEYVSIRCKSMAEAKQVVDAKNAR